MNDSLRQYLRVLHWLFIVALLVSIVFLDSTYFPFNRMGEGTQLIYFILALGYPPTVGYWIDDLLTKDVNATE